ncbi:MAG: ferredoxin [Gemmatimonadetes bacterium]|nr:ferredoxin [Gemmatimonadota bacterium]
MEVTKSCIGCTGCAAVCPTAAIEAIPDGIAVIDELCVSCGYCQAGCAVDGIRVLQGRDIA